MDKNVHTHTRKNPSFPYVDFKNNISLIAGLVLAQMAHTLIVSLNETKGSW